MNSTILFINQIRHTENHDWVIFTILGCIFLYLFMMMVLERGISLKDFVLQEFTVSGNTFLSWIISSVVFSLGFSVLLSQYIPIVPSFTKEYGILGLELNKFGYMIWVVLLYYFIRATLTYFFFQSIGQPRKWSLFYFTATKFYFILSLVVLAMCILHYYYDLDKRFLFSVYLVFFAIVFIFKHIFYIFHKNNILPDKWYYKILYICTLQFAPVLMLWKLLFF